MAEFAGANLLVIIDTNDDDVKEDLILSDDGSGSDINIPTIMISKTDGYRLMEYKTEHPDTEI